VEEQVALVCIFVVVEIFTSGLMETFHRAPASVQVLHGVRCVRAAVAGVREHLLT